MDIESAPEQMLTVEDVAKLVKVSPASVRSWAAQGIGPRKIKIGPRAVRYRASDIAAWISAREVA